MSDSFHNAAIIACRLMLKPIIKILLRYGLSFKEFSDIAKRVYVEVANDSVELGASNSYVAVKTGLSRKEVGKLLKSNSEFFPKISVGTLPIRIMSIWFSNKRFQDETGNPIELRLDSNNGPSLSELVGYVSADIPETAILKVLVSSGAVTESGGVYKAKLRHFIEGQERSEVLIRSGFHIAALAETVIHNLEAAGNFELLRFQRTAYSLRLSEQNAVIFHRFMYKQATKFLSDIDDQLMSLEDVAAEEEQFSTGVGLYFFRSKIGPEFKGAIMDHFSVVGTQE